MPAALPATGHRRVPREGRVFSAGERWSDHTGSPVANSTSEYVAAARAPLPAPFRSFPAAELPSEEITIDEESEPVSVWLGVWVANTRARRDKLIPKPAGHAAGTRHEFGRAQHLCRSTRPGQRTAYQHRRNGCRCGITKASTRGTQAVRVSVTSSRSWGRPPSGTTPTRTTLTAPLPAGPPGLGRPGVSCSGVDGPLPAARGPDPRQDDAGHGFAVHGDVQVPVSVTDGEPPASTVTS